MGEKDTCINNLTEGGYSPSVLIDKNGIPLSQDAQSQTLGQISQLPASQSGVIDEYTALIQEHPITVIRAETGAGKTTQIPKNIRLNTGQRVNVTQPRVLAAISNGKRVAHELLCQELKDKYTIGYNEVGYRTGVESSSRRSSMLSFNTGGLEMMRQLYSNIVPDILFLDEAHHFSIDTEVLMWLYKTRRDIAKKLVIMSATIDPNVFIDYFTKDFGEIPVLDIPGRTYPVEHFYYENKDEAIPLTLSKISQGLSGLFFVSGKKELYDYIEKFKQAGVEIPIYPLHAELTEQQQMSAVVNTHREQRLIIATNVAEESITPEGIQFVVDLGKHKVSYPNSLGIEELVREDISKANSLQRGGRAGRLEDGEYHRFHSNSLDELDPYPVPPMSKNMLDREILLFLNKGKDIRKLHEESRKKGESLFSHEINASLLPISYARLQTIGAIDEKGKITELGKDLLSFNLDIYHARMLIQSLFEGCTEEMIYMVCIFAAKGFLGTDDKWKELFETSYNKQTDVLYHLKMLVDFTSRKLSKQFTNKLAGMGIDYKQIEEFHEQTGSVSERKMFFEIVDLSPIGVKNYKLAEIYNLIFIIQKRLSSQGIDIDTSRVPRMKDIKNGKLQGIQTCLHAGYPFFLSNFDGKEKRFYSTEKGGGIGNLRFQAAKTSLVTPKGGESYSFYPFVIETEQDDKEDLHLASFITQVTPESEKKAYETSERYISPFPKKGKGKNTTIGNISDLEKKYLDILGDISKISSKVEFAEHILPYLVLVNTDKFRKFIERNPQKIDEIVQRLSRFFQQNFEEFKTRINLKDVSKTEHSFRYDSYIYKEFRRWEKSYVRTKKDTEKKQARLSPKQRNEAHTQLLVSEMRKNFIQLVGRYRSGSLNVDVKTKKKQIIGQVFSELMLTSPGLNEIQAFKEGEINGLTQSELQKICSRLSQREKKKNAIGHYQKYKRYLENISEELEKLSNGDIQEIDERFMLSLVRSRFFHSESRSQKDKYTGAVTRLIGNSKQRLSIKDKEFLKSEIRSLINVLKKGKYDLESNQEESHRSKSRIKRLQSMIEKLETLVDTGKGGISDEDIKNYESKNFEEVLDSQKTSIFVSRLREYVGERRDHITEKKVNSSKKAIRQFINKIQAEIQNIDLEISDKRKQISEYEDVPRAYSLKIYVQDFLKELFSGDTYIEKINEKIIDEIVLAIYRSSINSNQDVVDIIIDFLTQKKLINFVEKREIAEISEAERLLSDIRYTLDNGYTKEEVYQGILKVTDKEEMESIVTDLQEKIKSLEDIRSMILSK